MPLQLASKGGRVAARRGRRIRFIISDGAESDRRTRLHIRSTCCCTPFLPHSPLPLSPLSGKLCDCSAMILRKTKPSFSTLDLKSVKNRRCALARPPFLTTSLLRQSLRVRPSVRLLSSSGYCRTEATCAMCRAHYPSLAWPPHKFYNGAVKFRVLIHRSLPSLSPLSLAARPPFRTVRPVRLPNL